MKTLLLALSLMATSITGFANTSSVQTVVKCKGQDKFSKSMFRIVQQNGKLFGVYGKKYATTKKVNFMRFDCKRAKQTRSAGTAPTLDFTCIEQFHKNHTLNGPVHKAFVSSGGFAGFPQAKIYSEMPMPSGYRQIDSLMCQWGR